MDSHTRLIDTLRQFYGDTLFSHNGGTYPATFYPAHPGQDIDSILAATPPDTFADPAMYRVYDRGHLDTLLRERPGITNGLSYILNRVEDNRIHGHLGYYFDMLATCDALDHELRDYAQGKRDGLPLRQRFHEQVPPEHVTFNGAGRAAIIGVNTLTVFNHHGTYKAIVAQRASTLAIGAGLYQVLPAYVFQPSGPQAWMATEWSVRHQTLREYGEELFAMPEYHEWDGAADSADYFYDHAPVADLRRMLDTGQAEMILLGVAVNHLSTRSEIGVLLLIHDDTWFDRWHTELEAALLTERQATHYVPVDTLDGLPADLHKRMTPHGGAILWTGIDRAIAGRRG